MPLTADLRVPVAPMAYRSKTFVSFASEDIRAYRLIGFSRGTRRLDVIIVDNPYH